MIRRPAIPDVLAAIDALAVDPAPPGFGPATSQGYQFRYRPELETSLLYHVQGAARIECAGGASHFAVSISGPTPALAELGVYRFPDAPADGRPVRDAAVVGPRKGELVAKIRGRSDHPGGLQVCGSVVAVAQSTEEGQVDTPAWVDLVDLSEPAEPRLLAPITFADLPAAQRPKRLTAAALVARSGGPFLCFAYVYSSHRPEQRTAYLLYSDGPALSDHTVWTHVRPPYAADELADHWRADYQNVQLLEQADGRLFLVGMRGFQTDNELDVFGIHSDWSLRHVRRRKVVTAAAGGTFRAGSSLYVSPEGRLVLYASQKSGRWTLAMEELT